MCSRCHKVLVKGRQLVGEKGAYAHGYFLIRSAVYKFRGYARLIQFSSRRYPQCRQESWLLVGKLHCGAPLWIKM